MKAVKSFIVIISALFLLVGSVGVDVFSHFCEEDEVSVSYFVADEEHCEDHDHEKAQVDSCCEVEADHHEEQQCESEEEACCDGTVEDGCCQDEVKHIQLKLDFFDKYEISPVIVPELAAMPFFVLEEVPVDNTVREYHNNSPPISTGREINLKKQVWLI